MLMLVIQGALLGLGATVLMDLWGAVLARFPGQRPTNWAMVGRWFWHLREGTVFHDDIAAVAPYAHERALGWAGHYAIGVLYGVVFALIVGAGWFADPRFLPAFVFGIVTVAAGWFLLQPGMGLGWAASRAASPATARLRSLLNHTVFAIGLYGTAFLLR
jgi:small-conductance mechanosensitive channel